MADLATPYRLVDPSQAQHEIPVNNAINNAAPAIIFGKDDDTSGGLFWGVIGGRFGGTLVASTIVGPLTASNTNYLVIHRSTLAASVSTSTTNWNDGATYGRAYKITTGSATVTNWEDHRAGDSGILSPAGLAPTGTAGGDLTGTYPNPTVVAANVKTTESIIVAASDEVTALTAGTGKMTFRMPYAFIVTGIRASLTVAQASGSIFTVDVNESGTTILSTKLTIDNTEKTTTTAATPAVISDASLADDAEMTIDIDQVGDGTAKGLKISFIGHRT